MAEKKRSKYADMPEPPCDKILREYRACLPERQRWRAFHRGAKAQVVVAGPYVEENGQIMDGCVQGPMPPAAAYRWIGQYEERLKESEYLRGYSPALREQMVRRLRVVEVCPPVTRATGLPLDFVGDPSTFTDPEQQKAARLRQGIPLLSGTRKKAKRRGGGSGATVRFPARYRVTK